MDLASRHPRGTLVLSELNMRSLEDVLGPSAGRYFGHGYRGVRYGVKSSACLDGDPSQVSAEVHATYPPHWSVDSDGTPRLPHLSSIDATVLPLLVFEAANGDRRNQLSTRRVRVVELRAAGKPWLELDAIPVTLNVDVGDAGETLTSVVGNIRSCIALTDGPHPAALFNADVAPQYPLTVYGGLFQPRSTDGRWVSRVGVSGGRWRVGGRGECRVSYPGRPRCPRSCRGSGGG